MSKALGLQTFHVLHVDDDEFERSTVADALGRATNGGHQFLVKGARSIAEFWELGKLQAPDVILLDINLSGDPQEGMTIVPAIRDSFGEAVIIMRSSLDDAKTVQRSISLGADDFLSKRVGDAELGFRVASAILLADLKKGKCAPASAKAGSGTKRVTKPLAKFWDASPGRCLDSSHRPFPPST